MCNERLGPTVRSVVLHSHTERNKIRMLDSGNLEKISQPTYYTKPNDIRKLTQNNQTSKLIHVLGDFLNNNFSLHDIPIPYFFPCLYRNYTPLYQSHEHKKTLVCPVSLRSRRSCWGRGVIHLPQPVVLHSDARTITPWYSC